MNYTVIAGTGIPTCEARATPENPSFNLNDPEAWRVFGSGSMTQTGETVSHRKALTYSPVWQAVSKISGDVAKLPMDVFKRRSDGGRTRALKHQAAKLIAINGMANDETTGWQLWRRAMMSALLWNQAFVWIERSGPNPIGLYNLLPDRSFLYRHGGRLYVVTEVGVKLKPIPYEDCIHIEGPNISDRDPCDLVEKAREDIGRALARRKFASRFFHNNCSAGGILQVPPGTNDDVKKKVEKGIQERHTHSENAFRTMVLRDGFKWIQTTVNPEQSQVVEFDESDVRDVARWFNLRPVHLGVRDSQSYNSNDGDKQEYLDSSLSHWLMSRDTQAHTKMLTPNELEEDKTYIEVNVNALLWADPKSRSSIANEGIQSGRFTPDETRAWENMNPLPDGEGSKPLRPVNLVAAGEQPPSTKAGDSNTPPPPSGKISKSHRTLLANTVKRIIRRIGVHAERSATSPEKFNAWLASFEKEHRSAAAEMLVDVLDACSSLRAGRKRKLKPEQLADRVLRGCRQKLSQEKVREDLALLERRATGLARKVLSH